MLNQIILFGEFLSPAEWTVVGTISTAIYTMLTIGLFTISLCSLRKSNKLADFQVYQKISDMLSSDSASELIQKCKSNTLTLTTEIEKQKLKKELLNPLEDLAKFRKDKLISRGAVYSGFSSMILCVCNCNTVQNYIAEIRMDKTSAYAYGGLGDLYTEVYNYCYPSEVEGLKPKLFKIEKKAFKLRAKEWLSNRIDKKKKL